MPNRLIHETSPYLHQHAHNPVDWYPWGPEALERARREDRPILLSVGYSACHWCHVMERESFEAPAIAALMNAGFVCVKVDREERPDLDEIYMKAVQAFTGGHGGWPMTVFLTPDGRPYFGGTYFPPEPRGGMPGFPQVLAHAARLYRERGPQLEKVTADLLEWIQSGGRLPRTEPGLGEGWLEAVGEAAAQDFDSKNGGFGGAPKFPPYGQLAALLALHHRTGERAPLRMALFTLDAMAKGGMYDLLGGGFARYSVDDEWRVPHFEKMLYDNAQLLPLYTDAWKITRLPRYQRVVEQTVAYVLREMTHPDGGFYASQDADSEGVEGKFFAWTPRELREVLGFLDGMRAAVLLQVTEEGTFEHGSSVLRLETPTEDLPESDRALLDWALPKLFEARSARVAPGRDDKIVASWNGLMISALARAGAAFSRPDWVGAAARAARFAAERLTVDGRLRRAWKDDRAPLLGYLDDHAALLGGLLDLYEASFDLRWLRDATALCDRMIHLFWDTHDGGFFYTGHDAEALITRSRHLLGGAEPSGCGLAAMAMLRLGALTGRADLGDLAETALSAYRPYLERAPRALGHEALAAAWRLGPTAEIGVVGAPEAQDTAELVAEIHRTYLPFAVLARVAPGEGSALLPWMADRPAAGGRATAYVCEGGACQLPVQAVAELAAQLAPRRGGEGASGRDHAPALPAEATAWLNAEVPLTLDRLAGNVVVLDFWTYCCVNCMHVLPELAAIEDRFAGQPVAVVGVHSAKFPAEKERANVASALRRHRVRHPVVLDPRHQLWQAYAVHAWPTVMVLDPSGRIAWRGSGEVDREHLAGVIQDLLDEGRAAGTLSAPAWTPAAAVETGSALAFPGKVSVWPGALAQAGGADPFTLGARLYVADSGHHQIVEAALSRGADGWPVVAELRRFGSGAPGLADGSASEARFQAPQGVARQGRTLWVADTENHAIRTIDLDSGEVKTVGGTGELGRGRPVDPRRRAAIPLRSPWDVAVHAESPEGEPAAVLIAMAGAHQVWVYLPNRQHLGPFVGSGREDHVDGAPDEAALAQPSGLSLFGRYLFVADSEVSSVRVVDLGEHAVGTVLGEGLFDFGDVDGPVGEARLQHPLGLAAMGDQLYVADTFNHKIKVVDLEHGQVRTLAGGAGQLSEPGGLAVAGPFLIVADTNQHRIVAVHRSTGELRPVL